MNESEIKEPNIDMIVSNLYSDEARAKLISKIVGKSGISEIYIKKASDYYLSTDRPIEAADVLEKAGQKESAYAIIKKVIAEKEGSKEYKSAAELSKRIGDIEGAIGDYEKAGEWAIAAHHAKDIDELERAIKDYISGDKYSAAGDIAASLGQSERAKSLYEDGIVFSEMKEMFEHAGDIAVKKGEIERANEFYRKAVAQYENNAEKSLKGSAPVAEAPEKNGKTVDKDSKWYGQAADLAEKIGMHESAIKNNIKAGHVDLAERLAEKNALEDFLITVLDSEKRFEDAAYFVKTRGNSEKAAKYYQKAMEKAEQAGDFTAAEEIALRAGMPERARMYQQISAL